MAEKKKKNVEAVGEKNCMSFNIQYHYQHLRSQKQKLGNVFGNAF
jgi:hypothetical protein